MPASYREFDAWFEGKLASPDLHATEHALEMAPLVAFEQPVPAAARGNLAIQNHIIKGTLPPRVREIFGIPWSRAHEAAFRAVTAAHRRARPAFPRRVRRGRNDVLLRRRHQGRAPARRHRHPAAARRRLMKVRVSIPVLLAALALLLPASASAAIERTVSVTASATLKVPNDSASIGLSVSRERRTRGAALRAVSADLSGVVAAVRAIPGVGPGDITTGRISVRKSVLGERVVYRAAEGIGVTLHQPDKAGELVSAAIGAGATGVNGPNYFVGDSEAAFTDALGAAFDKAKMRATALATRAGAGLGPALTIDEGEGPTLTPQFDQAKSAPASDCAVSAPATPPIAKRTGACGAVPPPTKPGTSTVTATVHVVFALQ